jgi:hypothetical protein
MNPMELGLVVAGLVIGVGVGYDAERWGRNVNLWSLAGALFSVLALATWLVIRHEEAERRRDTWQPLPPGMWRWLRLRRQARAAGLD